MYSAKLGQQGFDLKYVMTREVFTSIWDLLKGEFMDEISPYREDDQYFVVKLSHGKIYNQFVVHYHTYVGGEELLSCDERGKYTVKGNTSGFILGGDGFRDSAQQKAVFDLYM